jgi:hypothetical protein
MSGRIVNLARAPERVARLETAVRRLLANSVSGAAVAPATWMATELPGTASTPRAIATAGGPEFDRLVGQLSSLVSIVTPGISDPDPEIDQLGLPLDKDFQARLADTRHRKQCHEERRAARQRKSSDATVARQRTHLASMIGADAADAWMETTLRLITGCTDGSRTLDDHEIARLETMVLTRCREAAREAGEVARRNEADRIARCCREDLLKAAATHFMDDERAALWCRSTHPRLGTSPELRSVDRRGLSECLAILASTSRKPPGHFR